MKTNEFKKLDNRFKLMDCKMFYRGDFMRQNKMLSRNVFFLSLIRVCT